MRREKVASDLRTPYVITYVYGVHGMENRSLDANGYVDIHIRRPQFKGSTDASRSILAFKARQLFLFSFGRLLIRNKICISSQILVTPYLRAFFSYFFSIFLYKVL